MAEAPDKSYDPLDSTLELGSGKDDLDPFASDDEDGPLTGRMSCGHFVKPDFLTQFCRHQLDQGDYKFKCPVLVEGTKKCNKPWSYPEVRKMAVLTVDEMQYFEEKIACLVSAERSKHQPCPQCKTNVERKDETNLCVQCPICSDRQERVYQFCWQCQMPWKGRGPRSDRCDNQGCSNKNLELLQRCQTINLPDVRGAINCPSVRACPKCGGIVQHSQRYCKNVTCPGCKLEYCFICLKTKKICNSSPFDLCESGVAPRQTSIPVLNKTPVRRLDDLIVARHRMLNEVGINGDQLRRFR